MKNERRRDFLRNSFMEKFEAVGAIQRLVDRILFFVCCFSNSSEHMVRV
jgi:hypothetical protein